MFKKFHDIGDNYRHVFNLFGIKFKFLSKRALIDTIKNNKNKILITDDRAFLFVNRDNMTKKEKECYIQNKFYNIVGYFPDLKNPKSFNEKLLWLELNYYDPRQEAFIDKFEFKNQITNILGENYVIPLIKCYDTVFDINFEELPKKFVLKTTNGGSGNYGILIVKNKNKLNVDFAKYKLNKWAQEWMSIYYSSLSRGYKDIRPRIIAEEYIEQENGQLYDYKFHCFHGEIKIILAVKDRIFGKGHKMSFLTSDWKELNIHRGDANLITKVEKPAAFDEMVKIAQKLSAPFPFVRVDFYNAKGKVYVGELTFTPMGGFGKYVPEKWDYILGEWLDLNKINKEYIIKEG